MWTLTVHHLIHKRAPVNCSISQFSHVRTCIFCNASICVCFTIVSFRVMDVNWNFYAFLSYPCLLYSVFLYFFSYCSNNMYRIKVVKLLVPYRNIHLPAFPLLGQSMPLVLPSRKSLVNKTLKPKRKAPMEITSTANHPFDKCYLDIVGPLPPSTTGHRYILTSG